jgi:hypothetical protein
VEFEGIGLPVMPVMPVVITAEREFFLLLFSCYQIHRGEPFCLENNDTPCQDYNGLNHKVHKEINRKDLLQ